MREITFDVKKMNCQTYSNGRMKSNDLMAERSSNSSCSIKRTHNRTKKENQINNKFVHEKTSKNTSFKYTYKTDYRSKYRSTKRSTNRSLIKSLTKSMMYIMNTTTKTFLIITIYLILLSAQFNQLNAYSTGAPDRACSTLIPQHNADPQRYFPSPYIITANKLGPNHNGREFNVSITAKTDSFKGFIIQARDYHDSDNLIVDGSFTPNLFTKIIKCKSNLANTLTHNSPSDKYYTSVIWKPSSNFKDGKLIFRATIVLNAKTFWIVDSNPVEIRSTDYGESSFK